MRGCNPGRILSKLSLSEGCQVRWRVVVDGLGQNVMWAATDCKPGHILVGR